MALKTARFLNLLLTGVLTGNEFGGFVGFTRRSTNCPPRPTREPSGP
jgi:hypothetical protein